MFARFLLIVLLTTPKSVAAAPDFAPQTVSIPAGAFLSGSTQEEKNYAYRLDEIAYGHSNTRKWGWYDDEPEIFARTTGPYSITKSPITNRQYKVFVESTGHPVPSVDAETWNGYGLIHPYERTRRHSWSDGNYPVNRADHPVVMVSWHDAVAYANWLSAQTGQVWRLPNNAEWEKAIRGVDGNIFPWGNNWDPEKADSHDKGEFDTVPVASNPHNVSPFGLTDAAGHIFEWTSHPKAKNRQFVRGGSWDDKGCGVCRPAARHTRPVGIKHILIGFRLVREVD